MADTLTKDLAGAIGEMKKLGASLGEAVERLNEPARRMHASADGDAISYWGDDETIHATMPHDGPHPRSKKMLRLPKGYKNEHFKSFGGFLREGWTAHKQQNVGEFKGRYESCYKAIQGMSATYGGDGGYFIMPEFNMQVMERVYQNDLWTRTDSYTVNNNMIFLANAETSRANGSRHGGLRGYWVAEGGSITSSKPTFRQVQVPLKKIAVVVYLTEELLSDGGPVLEQWVARKAAEEFNFMQGDALFNGSGAGQPLGIINAPSLLSITKESGQGSATLKVENLDKMWGRRHSAGSYVWYHNQDVEPALDKLAQEIGTSGTVMYRDAEGIAKPAPQTIKGAPRQVTEFNATLGTVGDVVLADLGQYITISKGGINQAVSTELEFLTDQMAVRFTFRLNGRPWETTAVTQYKGSNSQSSFLAVETR